MGCRYLQGYALARPMLDRTVATTADLIPDALRRHSAYLTHPVFNQHHSETEMLRYIRGLEAKDLDPEAD